MTYTLKKIAHIKSDFPEKFGIPRQSGLSNTRAEIIFEPEYRVREAFRGLDGFSHIWLLWEFSEAIRPDWQPMVHPPRLGGNRKMGVFATRSPFRPNPIGLSCVRLDGIEYTAGRGPVLHVSGADLMNGTPIYDIKPYLPYADSIPDALDGFAGEVRDYRLDVTFPDDLLALIPPEKRRAAIEILENDPHPAYRRDPGRVYGTAFAGFNIKFTIDGTRLTVIKVEDYAEFKKRADKSG